MTAQLIDGRKVADQFKNDIQAKISERVNQGKQPPGLVVILVGENPASATYVRHKQKGCEQVGIHSSVHHLPADTNAEHLKQLIQQLNQDPATHGILLQLPLPEQLNPDDFLELIDPKKDVDGFHPYNMGRLALRRPALRSCTPYGVIQLLKGHNIDIIGKNAVVIGASNIVGRPMALELLLAKATVTICHRFSSNLKQHLQDAEIVIAATGNPDIIQTDWLAPDSVVVDVGFTRKADGSICGDIDFDTAKQKVAWITPVPGGVGQMTVAMLLHNTLHAAELQEQA